MKANKKPIGKAILRALLLNLILLCLVSCKNQNDGESSAQIEGDYKSNDFTIEDAKQGFEKTPYGSVYAAQYVSKGYVHNNTQKILKDATLDLRFYLKLENGNDILDNQISVSDFVLANHLKILDGQFLSNDRKNFKLSSVSLTEEYKQYPIAKFYIQYILKGKDPLDNDAPFSEVIQQIDVTEKWRDFVKTFVGTEKPN
jgi:hypothetical protein